MKVYRNQDLRKLGSGNIGPPSLSRGVLAPLLDLIADGLKGSSRHVAIALGLGTMRSRWRRSGWPP